MERKRIDLPGKADGYLTKYLVPELAKDRLGAVCPPRGRSRWIADAIASFAACDAEQRNTMLLADGRLRTGKLTHLSVRLSQISQRQLRSMLTDFRKQFPHEDLETSGVFRAAILYHLRNKEGVTIND
ncbi:hypothetical protein [Marinobacter sp. MBR-105]